MFSRSVILQAPVVDRDIPRLCGSHVTILPYVCLKCGCWGKAKLETSDGTRAASSLSEPDLILP